MSGGQPRPHADMLCLALEVVKRLAEYTTRIAIAGSLRRGKATVGDIEIVCQPDFQHLPSGRSGFIHFKQNAVNWACDRLREDVVFEPRLNSNSNPQSWGDQQKWFRYQGVNVDLYSVLPGYSWGRELLIRTGPLDANTCLVTRQGVTNRQGIRGVCPEPFQFANRELYAGDVHVPTPEEKDVFAALKLPYIAPPLRAAATYQKWADRWAYREMPTEWGDDNPGQGWVGAPDVGGCVWLPVIEDGVERIDPTPRVLRFVKVGAQEQAAS